MGEDDDIDRSIVKHGWHAIGVDDHDPPFLYTCGLISQFRHPELVILGLDGKTAHPVVASIVKVIRNGTRLEVGASVELLGGLVIAIRAFHPSQHELYLGYAMAHARRHHSTLQALQVLWPDNNGRFPFDLTCDSEVRALQPRLELPASVSDLRAFRREFAGD